MTSRAKQKGYRGERKIVDLHHKAGLYCKRIPMSGAAGWMDDALKHDVAILGGDFSGEVKNRKDDKGFKIIRQWKGEADILFVIVNNQTPLVVMEWDVYEKIMSSYDKQK